jgi:hypothetical protein
MAGPARSTVERLAAGTSESLAPFRGIRAQDKCELRIGMADLVTEMPSER